MGYTVYVIRSEEGYRYTGMTEDINRRIEEHNNKSKSFWTKRGNNWQLIYSEEFSTKPEALKRERWMKNRWVRVFLRRMYFSKFD